MQLYLDQSIMQPVGVKVTIRGGGELLLLSHKKPMGAWGDAYASAFWTCL